MSEIHLNEYVVHYERKVKQKCDICASGFKFGRSQHICKRCLRSVCEECAPYKGKVYASNYINQQHRLCRKCNVQSQFLQKYVKNNHLKLGQDSDLVKLWMKKLGLQSIPRKRAGQKRKVRQYLTFDEVWKSLNFSFRQLVGITIDQSKKSQKQIIELINTALSQLATNKLADIQHLVYIVLFFLVHANVNHAVYFSTIIIQTIYTQEFSLQNMHYFLQQLSCNQIEVYKMESIIQQTFEKIAKRCTVNVFTAQFSIQIINQILIKRQFQELQKGMAYIFSQRKQFICQNANKPQQVFLDIIRNSTSTGYRKTIRQLDGLDPQMSPESRKGSCKSQSSDGLSKSSVASTRQIKKLKQQNQKLKNKVNQQQNQLEDIRKQNIVFQNQINAIRENQKKAIEANFSKNVNQIVFGKQKKKEKYDLSTSQQNDQLNYTSVIQKKNQDIIKLKKQIQGIKQVYNQAVLNAKSSQSERQNSVTDRRQLKQKDDQIQKLKQQNQSLKNTNKKLFNKLHQLSNLLMDKEQKNMHQANKFFDELPDSLQKQDSKEKLKQCRIF